MTIGVVDIVCHSAMVAQRQKSPKTAMWYLLQAIKSYD